MISLDKRPYSIDKEIWNIYKRYCNAVERGGGRTCRQSIKNAVGVWIFVTRRLSWKNNSSEEE